MRFLTFLMQKNATFDTNMFLYGLYTNLMPFLQTAYENPASSVPLGLHIIQWLHAAVQFKASSLTKRTKVQTDKF